jgi:hypothetical protein
MTLVTKGSGAWQKSVIGTIGLARAAADGLAARLTDLLGAGQP